MANSGSPPKVTIAGAGLAGLTAAHRLLQRGYDVTLLEANAFLGGKLGAHQDADDDAAVRSSGDARASCPACQDRGGCLRRNDWHEHSYHMYLNWYHNFWELMDEIGALDRFVRMPAVYNLHRSNSGASRPPAIPVVNVGSPWTTWRNMIAGLGTPADMFLWGQTMADLVGEPARRDTWLEKTSITAFMKSRLYTTDQALAGTYRTTAQAFASPSYLSSARSYKTLLTYGLRLPEPSMWLLTGSTQEAIFTPWLTRLAQIARSFEVEESEHFTPDAAFRAAIQARGTGPASGGRLTIRPLTGLLELGLDAATGRVTQLTLGRYNLSPSVHRGDEATARPQDPVPFEGDLIVAVPLSQLSWLVTPKAAAWAPELANVRYLRCEPMISVDLFFRRKLPDLPPGITVLLGSRYQMSFFDNSQTWTGGANDYTVLNVIASDADTLTPRNYSDQDILGLLLCELRRYLDFDPADLFECRTHLQTNVGEELFVNQVGSWQWRPSAVCGIPNLYIAGDYCRSFVDVVTVEGAMVSGLLAAEALRRRHGVGDPIRFQQPDQYPVLALSAAAAAQRPLAYAARVVSAADDAIKAGYRHWFPNG
ncbi:MAG TPA: FAD-dependent oxidoreductase [Acetobacteraceae bacterium]|nr:FAD-dependent oxidoreductase [Acetobacteraceae bacterium]